MSLLDWVAFGLAYAQAMQATARALADALAGLGLPVFAAGRGGTTSHQFALEAARWGGGQAASKRLEASRLLACGIGLPTALVAPVGGDTNGLRLGVPEIVRLGLGPAEMPELAGLIAQALAGEAVGEAVTALRQRFSGLRYVRS